MKTDVTTELMQLAESVFGAPVDDISMILVGDLDSLARLELMAIVECAVRRPVEDGTFDEHTTLADVVRFVDHVC